jgi:hypothetical protein
MLPSDTSRPTIIVMSANNMHTYSTYKRQNCINAPVFKHLVAFNVHTIAIPPIMQIFIIFKPLTQHVSAINGHLQDFNYANSVTLHLTGRAIAEAVSRWIPTTPARVRARVWQVGFVVDKIAPGQVFSEYFGFPCQLHFIPPTSPSSQSPGTGTIGQYMAAVPRGPSMDSTPQTSRRLLDDSHANTAIHLLQVVQVYCRLPAFICSLYCTLQGNGWHVSAIS